MTDLFEAYTRARSTDPITSHQAAEVIMPYISARQMEVYRFFQLHGENGFTDWEIEEWFGNHGATYRTRRAELTEMELLVPAGTRKIKGRNRIVWKLAHQPLERVPF